ncbi:MAG: hypothetical protein GY861_25405 [bacterium]|nr:hypothetical protein [bacterium]
MDSKEAVELIEKTVSLETLKKWDEGTKDKIIKGAIKRQFKYLTEDEKIVTEKKDAKPELKDSKDSKKIDKIVKAK